MSKGLNGDGMESQVFLGYVYLQCVAVDGAAAAALDVGYAIGLVHLVGLVGNAGDHLYSCPLRVYQFSHITTDNHIIPIEY